MIREGYIISTNSFKHNFLKELALEKGFLNYKFLTKQAFITAILGNITEDGIIYLSNKEDVKNVYNAVEYIKYLPFIENVQYKSTKLNFLKKLKLDLIQKGYYVYDSLLIKMLNENNITFINTTKDKTLDYVLKKLDNKNIYFENFKEDEHDISYYPFRTIESEMNFVFKSIIDLINNNVAYKDIKLCNLNSDYTFLLNRLSDSLKLPISLPKENNVLTRSSAKLFMSLLDKYDSFDSLFADLKGKISDNDYQDYLNLCNSFDQFLYKPIEVKGYIQYKLENMSFKSDRFTESIELISLSDLKDYKDKYVFLLNFDVNVPTVVKDNGYLTDTEFDELKISTSLEKSTLNKSELIDTIKSIKNLNITFSQTHAFNNAIESGLVKELNLESKEYKNEYGIDLVTDSLNLARSLDNYMKYGERDYYIDNAFDIKYDSYDNQFTGLSSDNIKKMLSHPFGLAYTSMDSFYDCKFKFYLQKILKIDKFEDSLQISLGNIAHKIFEDSYDASFDFDASLNSAIDEMLNKDSRENKELTNKEKFYINRMVKVVKEAIISNKTHEEASKLQKVLTENKFDVKIDDFVYFTGKIDKILYNEEEKKFVVIDYKTGTKKAILDNLKDGKNTQLPSYLYLIKNGTNKNVDLSSYKPIGMYLEHININKNDIIDDFKLKGYTSILKDDEELLDLSYTNIKFKKDNIPYSNSEPYLIDDSEFGKTIDLISKNINNFIKEYKKANFEIKYTELDDDTPCKLCKYEDVCFKTVMNKNKLVSDPFKLKSKKKNEEEE